jgi:hypothetical protein
MPTHRAQSHIAQTRDTGIEVLHMTKDTEMNQTTEDAIKANIESVEDISYNDKTPHP